MARARSVLLRLLVAAILLSGAVVVTWPLTIHATRKLPELRDPVLIAWTLAWDAGRLRHAFHGVWEAPASGCGRRCRGRASSWPIAQQSARRLVRNERGHRVPDVARSRAGVVGPPFSGSRPVLTLYRFVFGINGLRAPARFATIVYLALSSVAANGTAWLVARLRARGYRRLTAMSVAAAVLAAVAGAFGGPLPLAELGRGGRVQDGGLSTWLRTQPRGVVLELPIGSLDPGYRGFVYLYNTLVHGLPTVDGWLGYESDVELLLGGPASPFRHRNRVASGVGFARGLGVRYLVVHPDDVADAATGAMIVEEIQRAAGQWTEVEHFGRTVVFTLEPLTPDPPLPAVVPVPTRTLTLESSDAPDRLRLLFDGDVSSRWLTGHPQNGSEWIAITFPVHTAFRKIEFLVHPRSFGDYPRHLAIDGITDDGQTRRLFDGSVLPALGNALARDPGQPVVALQLPVNTSRLLRLRQTAASDEPWFWSIDELRLWADPARPFTLADSCEASAEQTRD